MIVQYDFAHHYKDVKHVYFSEMTETIFKIMSLST